MTTSTQQRYMYRTEHVAVCDADLTIAQTVVGLLYFPIRATCRALDIDAPWQIESIKGDSRFAPALASIPLPTAGGAQLTQCLPKREYAWWLAVIDPDRCKASVRRALVMRQRALMDVADQVMLASDREAVGALMAGRKGGVAVPGEVHLNCLRCGAPHCLVLDTTGIHLYVGDEEGE
ncbi:MAG TPA: phage antirepressor N-terminal domain-containing protein [Ktedonobacterales bacterium]|nr:phage antirepressor N-terminal domain-containing protein [Ktedonobacterales bacterium]